MGEKHISIAVIGTGISDLAAIKEFVGERFDVMAFEKGDQITGLRPYSDNPSQQYCNYLSN